MASNSQVETFAALRFQIDSDRWVGVPFYGRIGKRLPVTATEVLVEFKRPSRPVLDGTEPPLANHFSLSSQSRCAAGDRTKRIGSSAKVVGISPKETA